jgi:NitT/TauT family transport system substrate-binding protein
MTRRRAVMWVLAVLAALVVAVVAIGCGDDEEDNSAQQDAADTGTTQAAAKDLGEVTLRLDWVVDGAATCYYAALDKGYYKEEGLDVTIKEGKGSGLSLTLIGNNSDDFAVADFGAMAKSIGEGVEATMIMGLFQKSPHVIVSMKKSGINGPQDLAGKRVGATAGESPLALLPAYLATNGVDEGSVKIVNLDPSAKLPALYAGRIDAMVGFATVEPAIAEVQKPGEIATQYYADHGVVGLSSGIITNPATVEERPDVARGFVKALQKAYQFCQESPEEAVDMLVERFPKKVKKEEAMASLKIVNGLPHTERTEGKPIGFIDAADAEDTLETLKKYGDLKDVSSVDTYYTDEFAR